MGSSRKTGALAKSRCALASTLFPEFECDVPKKIKKHPGKILSVRSVTHFVEFREDRRKNEREPGTMQAEAAAFEFGA
jgi:hypothetical protein